MCVRVCVLVCTEHQMIFLRLCYYRNKTENVLKVDPYAIPYVLHSYCICESFFSVVLRNVSLKVLPSFTIHSGIAYIAFGFEQPSQIANDVGFWCSCR